MQVLYLPLIVEPFSSRIVVKEVGHEVRVTERPDVELPVYDVNNLNTSDISSSTVDTLSTRKEDASTTANTSDINHPTSTTTTTSNSTQPSTSTNISIDAHSITDPTATPTTPTSNATTVTPTIPTSTATPTTPTSNVTTATPTIPTSTASPTTPITTATPITPITTATPTTTTDHSNEEPKTTIKEETTNATTTTPPIVPLPTGQHWSRNMSRLLQLAEQISDFNIPKNILDSLVPQPRPKHLTHEQLTAKLKGIAKTYPSIARLTSIGKSVHDRDLWVLEISDNVGKHESGEPELKYIGNMHGNEVVSRVVLTSLCDLLTSNYGRNELVTRLVDSTRISILVSMNPDGYAIAIPGKYRENEVLGRENANLVDLNRNFPDRLGVKNRNGRQPETQAVMNWSNDNYFVLSANLHGGSLVANYPYDESDGKSLYAKSPDDKEFKRLCETYSLAHSRMHLAQPCPGESETFNKGITNGAHWYNVSGGMQDWSYINTGALSITLELSCWKYPYENHLLKYWRENANPLLVFVSQIHTGVKGYVFDKKTGTALSMATIRVDGIKHDVQASIMGDYWRLLPPGKYMISASSESYKTLKQMVTVHEGFSAAVTLNFSLEYTWSRTEDFGIIENMKTEYMKKNDFFEELEKITRSMQYLVSMKRLSNSATVKQDIFALQLSNQSVPASKDHRIKVTFIGSLNADSPLGTEVLIRFIRYLIYGFTTQDPKIKMLFDEFAFTFLVVKNYDLETEPIPNDCKGVNFKGELFEYLFNDKVSKLPEVEFIKSFFNDDRQHLVVSLQGQGHTVRYPLSYSNSNLKIKSKDDETFKYLSNSLIADASFSNCGKQTPMIDNDGEGGNKADSLMDLLYHKYGTLMVTKNIDCCKYPTGASLPKIYESTHMLMLSYLQSVKQGIIGLVLPAEAQHLKVKVNGSPIMVNKDNTFFRTLSVGTHLLSIEAPGYIDFVSEVKVIKGQSEQKLFSLVKKSGKYAYRDRDQAEVLYKRLSLQYPSIFNVRTIGTTVMNKPIDALVIGTSKPRVRVRLVAGMDGRDWVNREFLLLFAETLLKRYSTEQLTKNLLDKIQISIVPSLNIDGAYQAESGTCDTEDGKFNANGVDLDKLFRVAFEKDQLTMSEPETRAIIEWSMNTTFTLTVTFGIGHIAAVYPKGANPEESAITLDLAKQYAAMNPAFLKNNCSGEKFKNGIAESRFITGDSKSSLRDWSFQVLGSLSLSLYTSCCGFPDDDGKSVASVWNENYRPLVHLITKMERGISGTVKDSSGPVNNVTLTLEDFPTYKYRTNADGRFYFYLPKGVYMLTITGQNYYNTTKEIVIGDDKNIAVEILISKNIYSSDTFLITIGVTLLLVALLFLGGAVLLNRRRKRKSEYSFHKLDGVESDQDDTDQELELTARQLLSARNNNKPMLPLTNQRRAGRRIEDRVQLFDSGDSSDEVEIF